MDGVKLVVNKVLSSHFQVLPLLWPLLPVPPRLWEGGCGAPLTSLACETCCLESGDPLHLPARLGFSKPAGREEDEGGTGMETEQEVSALLWPLSPQVTHTVHMSTLGLPGYHLHAAYAGDWQLSPTEVRAPRTWAISPTVHLGPGPGRGANVGVVGRMGRAPACFSGFFLLSGRGWGHIPVW